MKVATFLASAILAFAFAEITRTTFNNYVVKHCHVVYTVVYEHGVATCRSGVQVYGPAQPIKD
jgi:hypothetical protein